MFPELEIHEQSTSNLFNFLSTYFSFIIPFWSLDYKYIEMNANYHKNRIVARKNITKQACMTCIHAYKPFIAHVLIRK
jgi:hypothetical protein